MDTKVALITLLALAGTTLFFMDTSEVPMSQDMPEDTENEYIFQLYQTWKTKYGKNVNDDFEDAYRFSVFRENHFFVEQHNAESTGVDALKLELNEFAAMTNEEFSSSMFVENFAELQQEVDEEELDLSFVGNGLPSKLDWVQKGGVNTPMQQGNCGSCWTFSMTAGLEGLAFNETGQLQKFSEQGIVSCAHGAYMNGCSGGSTTVGYGWTSTHGVQSEQDYPYQDAGRKVASPCDTSKTNNVAFKNPGGNKRVYGVVSYIQQQASKQVLSVSINATSIYFQLYQTGTITTTHCPTDVNHAVTLVGYDMNADVPYWKIKNSWGAKWGMHGFFQLQVREGRGTCGVNQYVDAPQM